MDTTARRYSIGYQSERPPAPDFGTYFANVTSDRIEQWDGEKWQIVAEPFAGAPKDSDGRPLLFAADGRVNGPNGGPIGGGGGGGGVGGGGTGVGVSPRQAGDPPVTAAIAFPGAVGTATVAQGNSHADMGFLGNSYNAGTNQAVPGVPYVLRHIAAYTFPGSSRGCAVIAAAVFCVAAAGALAGRLSIYIDGVELAGANITTSPKGSATVMAVLSSVSVPAMPLGVHDLRVELATTNVNTIGINSDWFEATGFDVLP